MRRSRNEIRGIEKAGVQVTAAKIGPFHATIAFGYAHDQLSGAGT